MCPADDARLRAYIGRILGWRNAGVIDRALRSIHLAARHQAALVLRGEGDLVPLALALHRRAIGVEAPFVVADPRRGNTPASVRSPANFDRGLTAFEAAREGTLCVRARRPPADFAAVVSAVRDPSSRVQLTVCCPPGNDADPLLTVPAPLDVPSLRDRAGDIERIIDECAQEAAAILGAREALTTRECEWILEHAATSLDEIERATLRLTAIRASTSSGAAAARLGMSLVSLSRWIHRRRHRSLGADRAR